MLITRYGRRREREKIATHKLRWAQYYRMLVKPAKPHVEVGDVEIEIGIEICPGRLEPVITCSEGVLSTEETST